MKHYRGRIQLIVSLLFSGMLVACASSSGPDVVEPPEKMVMPMMKVKQIPESQGSIYGAGWTMSLFDDRRARQIGDIITVRLEERTNASKQSSTKTGKDHTLAMPSPTIFGGTPSYNGKDVLNNSFETENTFEGEGSSSQSNSLEGTVTVVVVDVLPNSNLIVEGEKWMTINQGEEFVRFSGVIRPADIDTDNSIPSWKIAGANIAYSGKGVIADANRMGWLSRFFQSVFSPF